MQLHTIKFITCLIYFYDLYIEFGDLRIFGGGNIGKLEFWYDNNTWGSVCRYGFDYEEARVACRQLGYDDGDLYHNRTAE